MPNNNDNISLEQATAADVDREPLNAEEIDEGAENEKDEFAKNREEDRRKYFSASISVALATCVVFYVALLVWIFSGNTENWHVGLMLLLPPTTLLLTLIPVLKYKAPNKYGAEEALTPLTEQVKRIVKILEPFKELFKKD